MGLSPGPSRDLLWLANKKLVADFARPRRRLQKNVKILKKNLKIIPFLKPKSRVFF